MKCRKISQIVLLVTGITMIGYGAVRGEAAVVLGKAIKLCLECVGIGLEKKITVRADSRDTRVDTGCCHTAY